MIYTLIWNQKRNYRTFFISSNEGSNTEEITERFKKFENQSKLVIKMVENKGVLKFNDFFNLRCLKQKKWNL